MTVNRLRSPGYRWMPREEWLPDAAATAALLALAAVEATLRRTSPHASGLYALIPAYCLPLLWRRRFPRLVLLVVTSTGITLIATVKQGGLISFFLAALLASYTAGRECEWPETLWAPAIILGEGWPFFALHHGVLSDYVYIALLYGGAWAVGVGFWRRESRITALTSEAVALRQQTAEQAREAVAAERRRIARELHDLVSHSISVIAVQTQVVRLRLPAQRVDDIADLRAVEATARQALSEMRRLLGVLREDDVAADRSPTPGLQDLPALLREHEAAGGAVICSITGTARDLPSGVDLVAFRVVQEALTNSRKHSATVDPVQVELSYGHATVTVTVVDPGPARTTTAMPVGQGLLGMRERVLLYGGTLTVHPAADGRWTVTATMPVNEHAG